MRITNGIAIAILLVSSSAIADEDAPLQNWPVAFDSIQHASAAPGHLRIAANSLPSAPSHFIAMVPCRVFDTRLPPGPFGGPTMAVNEIRSVAMPAGPCSGIPSNAASYSVAITIRSPQTDGRVTAWPTGAAQPSVATVNFTAGGRVTNAAVVPAGTNGSIDVFVSAQTDLVIDINGYFVEGVVTNLNPGSGLSGGGTGNVTLGIAPGGVGTAQLGANAVTAGAIASGQVVKSINNATDSVTIQGSGGATVTTSGSTITIAAGGAAGAPSGSVILGKPGDTGLVAAGFTEIGPSTLDAWRATSLTNAPTERLGHSAVWTGSKMIVWGGQARSGVTWTYSNSGALYDPIADTWTPMTTTNAPTPRVYHVAFWTGSKMIIWGGTDNTSGVYINSGGVYSPDTNTWAPMSLTNAPSGRSDFSAVWTGSKLIIWGGLDESITHSGAQYDPSSDTWTPMSTAGAPDARFAHVAVWTGSEMIVWGGQTSAGIDDGGGQYDPSSDTWSPISLAAAPQGRMYASGVWTGTKMIVWGGTGLFAPPNNYTVVTNTGGQYDPVAAAWTDTSTAGAPSPRYYHSAIWTGTKMIVWGGLKTGAEPPLNTGALYDSDANSWTVLSANAAPSVRWEHTAIWTGDRMIVWGGYHGPSVPQGLLNTGAQWFYLSLYQKN